MSRIAFRTREPSLPVVPVSGWVAGVLAEDRRQTERSRGLRRLNPERGIEKAAARRGLLGARVWALRVGFTARQADAAAVAALRLKAGRHGGPVLKADVEAGLRLAQPWLFEGEGTTG